MKLCYIAGPYRPTPNQKARGYEPEVAIAINRQRARETASLVAELGYAPVVPHLMSSGIEDIGDDQYWLNFTMEILLRCECYALAHDWAASEGTRLEIEAAQANGLYLVTLK